MYQNVVQFGSLWSTQVINKPDSNIPAFKKNLIIKEFSCVLL